MTCLRGVVEMGFCVFLAEWGTLRDRVKTIGHIASGVAILQENSKREDSGLRAKLSTI